MNSVFPFWEGSVGQSSDGPATLETVEWKASLSVRPMNVLPRFKKPLLQMVLICTVAMMLLPVGRLPKTDSCGCVSQVKLSLPEVVEVETQSCCQSKAPSCCQSAEAKTQSRPSCCSAKAAEISRACCRLGTSSCNCVDCTCSGDPRRSDHPGPIPTSPQTELVFLAATDVVCFREIVDPNDTRCGCPAGCGMQALTAQQTCVFLSRFRC